MQLPHLDRCPSSLVAAPGGEEREERMALADWEERGNVMLEYTPRVRR